MSTAPPTTYKQPSRKGKKAWRKNVDITEVQAGLEELREEIITGGPIKEQPDTKLFTIDTTGSTKIAKSIKATKTLKSTEILAARSNIPAVSSLKRCFATNVTDGVIPEKKRRKNALSYKELEQLRRIADGATQVPASSLKKETVPGVDLWAEEVKPKVLDERLSFLEEKKPIREPVTLKQAPVSLAASVKVVPAVRQPNAGISYNPEFVKWDELLQKEGEKEVELEKKRLVEKEKEKKIRELTALPDPESADDESEDDSEEDESKDGENEMVKKKRPERKTQVQRNKIKTRKEQERLRLQEYRAKKQAHELQLIKKYTKAIEAQEKVKLAKLAAGEPLNNDDEKNPQLMRKKKLGKFHIPIAPLELQLPDELSESLRTLKPEGNLLRDRFRSLRERGILEARVPVTQRRKYAPKQVEKWSYKDFK